VYDLVGVVADLLGAAIPNIIIHILDLDIGATGCIALFEADNIAGERMVKQIIRHWLNIDTFAFAEIFYRVIHIHNDILQITGDLSIPILLFVTFFVTNAIY